jgi:hypothetical protein
MEGSVVEPEQRIRLIPHKHGERLHLIKIHEHALTVSTTRNSPYD